MATGYLKMPEKLMRKKKKTGERFKTGPHGEKRPMSETANAVRIMEIATGLAEEEYVNEKDKK